MDGAMTDITMSGVSRLGYCLPRLGVGLAALALLLLALAPSGWRTGLWHFRTSFYYLMQPSAYLGIAGGIVSLVALLWWSEAGTAGHAMTAAGIVIGAVMFYVPWSYYCTLHQVPRIHDITTDTANPPSFSPAILTAREAERANAAAYDPRVGALQKEGYPDIGPVRTAMPPSKAFERALLAAESMSGWRIATEDPAQGVIDASQSSTFFGFTDDIAIRVTADGAGSRIDIRSESRQGVSDFGVNAKRVRAYMETLAQMLQPSP